jgi:hypothetical protein
VTLTSLKTQQQQMPRKEKNGFLLRPSQNGNDMNGVAFRDRNKVFFLLNHFSSVGKGFEVIS